MSEGDIAEPLRGGGQGSAHIVPFPAAQKRVSFDRVELQTILNLYGRKVAEGEWRDYAIDGLKDAAAFSVFRRSNEAPLYRIEKRPSLARKQGAWSVTGQGGVVLKRGHELEQVLRLFDTKRFTVVK